MEDEHSEDAVTASEVRRADFPRTRRGYDPDAVHDFLERVANWVDGKAGDAGEVVESAKSSVTGEFTNVGERTAGILTAAEEAAAKIRGDAKEYSERLRREAKEHADRVRASADEQTNKAKEDASARAKALIAQAEKKADAMVEEAIARRRRLNEAVASLLERREAIADDAQRLADALLEAVTAIRGDDALARDIEADEKREPAQGGADRDGGPRDLGSKLPGEPTALNPPDRRETTIHEGR